MEIFDGKLNTTNNYINIIKALQTGPVVTLMEVPLSSPNFGLDFYSYANGIYTSPYCGKCVPTFTSKGALTSNSLNACLGLVNHGKS